MMATLLAGCVWLSISSASQTGRPAVVIKPLGNVDPALVDLVCQGISKALDVREVTPLPPQELPASSYYEPGKRYRAERIIEFLNGMGVKPPIKVIGLTSVDISTTKGQYEDWGIFGMAFIGGPACIVSTYRLGRGKVDPELFKERLLRVVTHELGHLLGLPHCPTPGCIMQDAQGKIATIDRSDGRFCGVCLRRLGTPGATGD